jgi:hypothetical protein
LILNKKTFFRTKIQKVRRRRSKIKKDNPKEIFYEFFKLFRENEKCFSSSSSDPLSERNLATNLAIAG